MTHLPAVKNKQVLFILHSLLRWIIINTIPCLLFPFYFTAATQIVSSFIPAPPEGNMDQAEQKRKGEERENGREWRGCSDGGEGREREGENKRGKGERDKRE